MKNSKLDQEWSPSSNPDPALSLTDEERRLYKEFSNWEGVFMAIFLASFGGSVIAAYELYLGFTSSQIGLLSGSVLFAQIFGLFGLNLVGVLGTRKILTIQLRSAAMSTLSLLLILPIPLLAPIRFLFFWGSITIQAVFASLSAAIWSSWWNSALTNSERSSFSAKRHAISSIASLVFILLFGNILDHIPVPFNFLIVFAIGNIAGHLSSHVMKKQPETSYRVPRRTNIIKSFYLVIRNARFSDLGKFTLIFFISFAMTGSFYFIYLIKDLHVSLNECAIWTIVGRQSAVYFIRRWGYLANRFNVKDVLIICLAISAVVLPIATIFTTSTFTFPIYIAAIIEGGCGAAVASLYLNLAYKRANAQEIDYVSVGYNVLMGLGGGIGTIAAGFLLDALGKTQLPLVFGQNLVPFDVIAIASSVIRFGSIVLIARIFEPNALPFRKMLPYIIPTLFFFWKKPNFAEEKEKPDHK